MVKWATEDENPSKFEFAFSCFIFVLKKYGPKNVYIMSI
jgi:hypothetical protein